MDLIDSWIENHKNDIVKTVCELVKIPSAKSSASVGKPFGEGAYKALTRCLEIAEEMGFRTKLFDGYVGTCEYGEGEVRLAILCHLDVVPEGSGWSFEPFGAEIADGKIFGRGTIDDKGPTVATMYALKAVKEVGAKLDGAVRIIFGTDEENGSSDLEYYLKQEKMPPMVFTPDGSFPLINIEKGRLQTEFQRTLSDDSELISFVGGGTINAVAGTASATLKGIPVEVVNAEISRFDCDVSFSASENGGLTEIVAVGTGAHASTPQLGANAVTALISFLSRLELSGEVGRLINSLAQLFPHRDFNGKGAGIYCEDEVSGKVTQVLSVFNIQDKTAVGNTDMRFPVCATLSEMRSAMVARLEALGFSVSICDGVEPHCVDENSEFVQTLLKVYTEKTGREGKCLAIGGGTYVHGIDGGVAFGAEHPNINNNMHGADEFIGIDELLLDCKLYAHAIYELLKPRA